MSLWCEEKVLGRNGEMNVWYFTCVSTYLGCLVHRYLMKCYSVGAIYEGDKHLTSLNNADFLHPIPWEPEQERIVLSAFKPGHLPPLPLNMAETQTTNSPIFQALRLQTERKLSITVYTILINTSFFICVFVHLCILVLFLGEPWIISKKCP